MLIGLAVFESLLAAGQGVQEALRDASQVGPIRSARFFDENIIQAYKAIFAFGSAARWLRMLRIASVACCMPRLT